MRKIVLILMGLCFLPMAAMAQPLADRLPSDALIYIAARGADAAGPGYEGSHLKAVLDSTDFSELVNDFLPLAMKRIGQEDAEAGQVIGIVSAIAKPLWKHPHAIYVGALSLKDKAPMPAVALLCEAGADGPQLLKTLKDLVAQAQDAPMPIKVREEKGLVILTLGVMSAEFDAMISGAADGGGKSLANDTAFKDAATQVVKDPSVAFYFNVEKILANAGKLIDQLGDPQAKEMFPKIRDGLGLGGLKQIMVAGGFDGKDWMEAGFVAAPAPRTGLLKLGDGKPLSMELLKLIPKTSTQMAAGRFSFSGLIAAIRDGAAQFDPSARDHVDGALNQASQMVGVDIQREVLGALGDEWAAYTDPAMGGYGLAGSVLVNRLADGAKAEQSFTKVEQFINQMAAGALQQAPEKITIAFQTRKVGDLTLHYLAIPLVTPTWCIRDGNLYIALYPQAAIAAAEFVANKGPSILENDDFAAVRKRLGQENAAAIQFADLVREAPINYGSWVALSRLVGIGDLFGIKSPLLMLPPLQKLLANLGPAGAVSWSDEFGLHMRSVSPFPGSTLLGTDPVAAYMTSLTPLSLAFGVAMPAVAKAREAAMGQKDANNLKQIGLGCFLYANEHNGNFPPDLGTLTAEDLHPQNFMSSRASDQPAPDVGQMTREQQAAWINEHSDYVYLGKGRNTKTTGADVPMAHEKFDGGENQSVHVLFGDGHVEWMPATRARELIADAVPKKP